MNKFIYILLAAILLPSCTQFQKQDIGNYNVLSADMPDYDKEVTITSPTKVNEVYLYLKGLMKSKKPYISTIDPKTAKFCNDIRQSGGSISIQSSHILIQFYFSNTDSNDSADFCIHDEIGKYILTGKGQKEVILQENELNFPQLPAINSILQKRRLQQN